MARTAKQREAAMKNPGKSKGGRSKKEKEQRMDRISRYSGIKGAHPGLAAPVTKEGDDSLWDDVKSVGENTLHALSVPQAALFTTIAKASGRDLSWKNMAGDFRTNAKGQTGSQAALDSMGIDNKWAQLGVSLVADPLWLVGGGVVKAARAGQEVAKVAESGSKAIELASEVSASKATIRRLASNAKRAKSSEARDRNLKLIDKERKKQKAAEAELKGIKDTEKAEKKAANTPADEIASIDDVGNIEGYGPFLKKLRQAEEARTTREGMNWSLNLGAGKFKKKIDLGIRAQRSLFGKRPSMKPGYFAMKPIEQIAHSLRRSGAETAEGATGAILRLAEKHGMTHVDETGARVINEADATAVGLYRETRAINHEVGEQVRQRLMETGRWGANHDALVKEMDARFKYLKGADLDAKAANAIPHQGEIDTLTGQIKELEKKLAKQDKKGKSNKSMQNLKEKIERKKEQLRLIGERGEYTPRGVNRAKWDEYMQKQQQAVRRGEQTAGYEYLRVRPVTEQLGERELLKEGGFAVMTPDEFVDDITKAGFSEDEAMQLMADIDTNLHRKGLEGSTFRNEPHALDVKPEFNAFLLAGRREQKHIWRQVEKETEELLKLSGLSGGKTAMEQAIRTGRIQEQMGTISGSKVGVAGRNAIAHLKGLLTFVNPAHYVTNAWGDFWNSMINGNWRHAASTASVPKSQIWRTAGAELYAGGGKINDAALAKKWVIGDKEYTGHELLALSRMSGLGRGYVGTDVAIMVDAFEKAGNPIKEFYRWAQRMNIKRENAQRMHTWIKHMRGGDDPMVAAAKTLRVHFDYTQLTEFEKLWMRNLLLFYTWLKRNSLLQASGMVTRPGLYNAVYNNFERTREKFPNEPDYFSKQGAIPIPGLGAFSPGSPWQDIFKWNLSWDGFRKDVLGAVTPPVRVPVELAMNQKMFTGERIQDYEGEVTPNWLAQVTGLGTTTTAKSGGEKAQGINPYLAHAISQFTGPQAATAATAMSPDYEPEGWQTVVGRVTGARPQLEKPEQWARSAKYVAAKEKADETRRKNAQRD